MNRLIIGSVIALFTPDPTFRPDDRQELVKTVTYSGGVFSAGVVVIDGGNVPNGRIDAYSGVKFSAADFATVKTLADARTLSTVVGTDGVSVSNCRVVLKSWFIIKNFTSVTADIEIWRV